MNQQSAATFLLGALAGATLTFGLLKATAKPNPPNAITKLNAPETAQDSSSALSDLLQNTAIEYILTPTSKPVILIEYNSTTDPYRSSIDFSLMLMEDNNIVSIPVVCLEKRRYLGMLNVLDIVAYLASHFTSSQHENRQELAAALRIVSVAEVLKSNREPFLPLYATSPLTLLLHVMTTLADEVPIMGGEFQIVNIVHRLDVLKFIQDNIETLGSRADSEVRTFIRPLQSSNNWETINTDTSVVDALRSMDKAGVSELAIVNAAGKLEGNLVAADLRRLSMYNLDRLYEPVSKFVPTSPDRIVWVEPSSTLRQVISKFVDTKTPVVWVVDSNSTFRPVDAITLRTIMKLLLDYVSNPPSS